MINGSDTILKIIIEEEKNKRKRDREIYYLYFNLFDTIASYL